MITREHVRFYLEWATNRASIALLDHGIIPTAEIEASIKRQIMSLMTQVDFLYNGVAVNE